MYDKIGSVADLDLLGSKKVCKFGKSSVLRQTSKPAKFKLRNGIVMAEIYQFAKLFLLATFNLAIRQTLTLQNILPIW